jgi:hypothetical protein
MRMSLGSPKKKAAQRFKKLFDLWIVNGFQYPRKAGVTGLLAVPVAMLA